MTVETYVLYYIHYYPKNAQGKPDRLQSPIILWEFRMPRWLWLARSDTLDWIVARFKYFNPKHHVQGNISFYDHKTGLDVGYNTASSRLASAKGQVTKIENNIAEYVAGFRPTLFITDPRETDAYKAAIEKLNQKRALVWQCEQDLAAEIATLKNAHNEQTPNH